MIKRIRGTRDILPGETEKWQYIENLLRKICEEYGYQEIRTPIIEKADLFKRGVGDTTDIVQKEMYSFKDAGNREITLRPEATASSARAYMENKLYAETQPTKIYYIGPMFRYERPQAGRYRQFHQFGVECFATENPIADGEIIGLALELYRRLGLKDLTVHLNSVGCPKCRPQYRETLQNALKERFDELCPTCQGRYDKNPLRIFDCKSPVCQEIVETAPKILDCLCPECEEHFTKLKKYLDKAQISYQINSHLVRGLDYYTKTAFEIQMDEIGAQSAICGGGRYDGLMETIGGKPTPGVGFAIGMERLFPALESQNIEIPVDNSKDIFIAALGEKASFEAFVLAQKLRADNIKTEFDMLDRSLKAQMKLAAKHNAKYTVIIGENELKNKQAIIRDMSDSQQEEVALEELFKILKEKINK